METRVTTQSEPKASHKFSKRLLMLTAAGGLAFWTVDFVISVSPIAAEYKAAFSISSLPAALASAFVGGLLISLCVSFFLLCFFDRIPGKKTIFKALVLSFLFMITIEVLSALGNPTHASVYLLVDTGMNTPRFLALGLVIGSLFDRQKGKV
jgi:hypothetical protein